MEVHPIETRNSLNILVLDDDPTWRHFVRYTLQLDLQNTPLLASSGKEALAILAAQPIDVVLADLQMPVMNGFQFLQHARVQSPATKVVIMSAAFEPLTPAPTALIEAGASAIISKLEITTNLASLLCKVSNYCLKMTESAHSDARIVPAGREFQVGNPWLKH